MTDLSSKDREWFSALNGRIWDRHLDNFGSVHQFENGRLDAEEVEHLTRLIERHRLPCVLGSGPYGGLFMRIFDHSDFPGVAPDLLLAVGEKHFELPAGFDRWDERFEWFSKFTHSDSNRDVLAFYGLPAPGPRERYEY
jgi:hypothetical protein